MTKRDPVEEARAINQTALSWYENNARYYDSLIEPQPPAARADALRRLVALVPSGSTILEIGSGTGRDANYIENLGTSPPHRRHPSIHRPAKRARETGS